MKRYTLIMMLLLFTATVSNAQTVTSTTSVVETARREKVKVEKEKKTRSVGEYSLQKGYRGFVEAGASIDFGDLAGGFHIFTIHGYQFNRWLYLGGGIGLEGIDVWSMGVSMPVFADFRAYLTKTKVKPFFDVQAGYKICLKASEAGCYQCQNKYEGAHVALGFGIEYKWLSVKVAYDINRTRYEEDNYYYDTYYGGMICIGLGVNF